MTNTRTIARNASWFGLENLINIGVTVFSSIAIARTLGPSKTGYIVYVSYIAGVVSSLGGFGIPATTRKYMAEFLGMGDRGIARFIYFRTMLLQTGLATLATGGLLFWVLAHAPEEYKLASALIVLSIWPSMVNSISAQANVATEDLFANLPPSVVSILTYFVLIALTVVLHWGVIGIGAAQLSMRAVDFLLRLFPTFKRVLGWEATHLYPHELRTRMTSFAWQSVVSMTVALIVWNRSEVILLKNFCADIRQVAYYSVAFSMSDMLLFSAGIFGSATSATIFAQYGRDKSRLPEMTSAAFRYLAMSSIPVHFIATALAAQAVLLIYGHQYAGAAMVATVAPLLCMPKAFAGPVQSLLESNEQQRYVIMATFVAGIVDIGVAWSLIPSFGAVGACIGSGAAQLTAIGIMWTVGIRLYKVKLPWALVAKIVFISVLAALTAHFIAMRLAPVWAILIGGSAAFLVLFVLIYLMRVLEPEDHKRLIILSEMLPRHIVRYTDRLVALLTRPQPAGGGTSDTCLLPLNQTGAVNSFEGLSKLLARQGLTESRRPPVVVASVFQSGLNLMRDLEQKGIRVVGVDCYPNHQGFRSRYGRSFLCPNPDTEPDQWVAFMVSLAAAIGEKPVLIAAADIFVSAIGRHAKVLREHFIFSESGCILQATLSTKENQYALAREYGLPSPRSVYIQTVEELEAFCGQARFPVLLKPRSHREWEGLPTGNPLQGRKTISAKTREELLSHYESVRALVPQAVAQEEIVGPDSAKYCYLSVYAQAGQRLGACVVRELRAYPLLYGCATLVEPVVDEEIDRICNKFLLSLGFIGICEIELKRDSRDGRVLLIEVNPRVSGTGDCARYTGVETGYLHYLDLIGQTPSPMAATRLGFRHIMLVNDLTAFPKYLAQGQITWWKWFRSLSGPMEFFDFDCRDYSNAGSAAFRGVRALAGGLLRTWHIRK